MKTQNSVTSVAATGEAKADYDTVGFSLSLQEEAKTVPKAKEALLKKVAEVDSILKDLQSKGLVFVPGTFAKTYSTSQSGEWVNNKYVTKGYMISANISFQSNQLDKTTEVYNALLELKTVAISRPLFLLKDKEKLNKEALANAFAKVKARFVDECSVLGLDSNAFEIDAWEASYSDGRRSDNNRRSMGAVRAASAMHSYESANADPDDLEIESGQATVGVNLEVAFKNKS